MNSDNNLNSIYAAIGNTLPKLSIPAEILENFSQAIAGSIPDIKFFKPEFTIPSFNQTVMNDVLKSISTLNNSLGSIVNASILPLQKVSDVLSTLCNNEYFQNSFKYFDNISSAYTNSLYMELIQSLKSTQKNEIKAFDNLKKGEQAEFIKKIDQVIKEDLNTKSSFEKVNNWLKDLYKKNECLAKLFITILTIITFGITIADHMAKEKTYNTNIQNNYYIQNEKNSNQKNWKKVELCDVVEYSTERINASELCSKNYVGVDNLLQNCAGKIASEYVPRSGNFTKYQAGDTLLGNIRPYLKKIWFADRDGGASGDVLVVNPNDKLINPKYLFVVLSRDEFFDYDMQYSKGIKMPRGDKSAILKYELTLPPLPEQQAIAEVLQDVDELVRVLERQVTLKEGVRDGLRQRLMHPDGLASFGVDSRVNTRVKHENDSGGKHGNDSVSITPENDSGTYEPSGEWREVRLGEVGKVYGGYAFKSETYTDDGQYKVITIANVQNGELNLEKYNSVNTIPADIQEHQKLNCGDILISLTGNVGRVYKVDSDNCLLNQRVGLFAPNDIDNAFAYYLLNSKEFEAAIVDAGQGGAQANIKNSDIEKFKVHLPPLATQRHIAQILTDADEEIALLKQRLERYKLLRKWFTESLTTGKVRLPKFANNESYAQSGENGGQEL